MVVKKHLYTHMYKYKCVHADMCIYIYIYLYIYKCRDASVHICVYTHAESPTVLADTTDTYNHVCILESVCVYIYIYKYKHGLVLCPIMLVVRSASTASCAPHPTKFIMATAARDLERVKTHQQLPEILFCMCWVWGVGFRIKGFR